MDDYRAIRSKYMRPRPDAPAGRETSKRSRWVLWLIGALVILGWVCAMWESFWYPKYWMD